MPSVQAQAVKRFFSTYCEDEAADIAANGLFKCAMTDGLTAYP